jgi:hypothetical protein
MAYRVKLCSADRWLVLADEVVRNLRGLGYTAEAVGGESAALALTEECGTSSVPTLYVVCVHEKDRVIPLRLALRGHGRPGHRVIVCLLQLQLPLSMVSTIRTALENLKTHAAAPNELSERRRWRQHASPGRATRWWREHENDAA